MQSGSRADVAWAIAVALLIGTLFLVTLRPDVGGTEDSPKFQFLGQVLGTAHTPGYPFYTIATYVFTRVPIGTLAYRVNLFSAVAGVLSCLCIFFIARRLNVSRLLSAAAALAAATGYPVWSNAVTAEVYTLSALMSAATILFLIAWAQTGTSWRLYLACAIFAAGIGNHLTIVGLLPAALLYGILKDRSVLRPRVVAIAAAIGFLGVAQYGFVALRTIQGAPYLEARATTLRGLYDVIIARDVSWARFYQAADKVVGIEVPMLLEGLRVHMGTVTVVLVVIAIGIAMVRRNYEVLLIAGGAAGTLGMIANLWGDVVGFITPVVVLLWTLAAYGVQELLGAIVRSGPPSPAFSGLRRIGWLTLALPVWNVFAIYPRILPLLNPGEAPALRAIYGRLPPNSAVVAHNYFVARIFNYLDFSEEYDPDPSPKFLANDAPQVRAAAAEGRQVFALAEAVPWLTSQGLRFAPTALSRQPFEQWIEEQPEGTVVVAVAAGRLLPLEWLPSDGREGAARRANFSALAWTLGLAPRIDQGDDHLTLTHGAPDGRALGISADDTGIRVTWGDDVIGAIDRGLAVMAIRPTGRLIGTWAFTPDEEPGILLAPRAFVFQDELPCEVLRTGHAVKVSPIVNEGGWYATVDGRQVPATIAVAGGGSPADWRHQLINGRGKASISESTASPGTSLEARGTLFLDGAPGTRAVFQLTMAPNQPAVVATLESSEHAVRVCQVPVPRLHPAGAFETGPAADAHFGVGWHSAEDAGTKHFRWSRRSSTLRWRMDSAQPVRFILPLRAAHPDGATIRASLNGADAGACALPKGVWTECRIDIDGARTRSGINELTLTSDTFVPGPEGDPRELAFEMQAGRVRAGS